MVYVHMCVWGGVGEIIQVKREHTMSCSTALHFLPLRTGSLIEPGAKLWATNAHDPLVSGPHRVTRSVGIRGMHSAVPGFLYGAGHFNSGPSV